MARISATLETTEDKGPIYDQMREGLMEEAGEAAVGMMKNIYIVPIQKPSISRR